MGADRQSDRDTNPSKPMWLERDSSLTPMSRVRGGAVQCFSSDIDASFCGLNLAGWFQGPEEFPQKLVSKSLDGNNPFYLLWSDGHLTNLSHLNGIYLRRILKLRRGFRVRWRPNPSDAGVTFSFTIPVERARWETIHNH
ncbi:hypothetical protein ELH26_14420 [Rhizobium leguminosarum]|uniref:hypothetical protein n=1 Tax=Rhizobium leguminosarum TaxID=384 RepID=UPI00102F4D20|nr:hypothetical protein [Rhizobium leguminosarum]TBC95140.1 hypothetical protein ELH26_14420 [Rhizobium leguminosarum]